MKQLFESWRKYTSEDDPQESNTPRAAAIIWNNSRFRPVVDYRKEIPTGLRFLAPEALENLPQGHSGIILIKESGPNLKCVALDFGVGGTVCPKANKRNKIEIIRHKIGLWVPGGVRRVPLTARLPRQEGIKNVFFDVPKENRSAILRDHIIKILNNRQSKTANQFGFIPDVDYDAAYNYGMSPRCRLYTVIPHMGSSKGDNCGSYALKVAAAGLGRLSQAEAIAERSSFIGPDQVLPEMMDKNKPWWIEFAMSFGRS